MYKKILFAIVLAIIGFARSAAREAYAVLSSDEKTLTFYCDDLRATHTEVTYDLNIGNNSPYWTMQSEVIEHVVFDQSFGYAMPTTTSFWFANFSRLTSIEGLNFLNTSNVTSMRAMFYGCSALQTLDVSGFITSYVSDASSMFSSCQSLTTLNLTSFELYRATDLSYMFAGCSQLKTIYVSPEWTIHPNANTSYMFDYCSNNLVGGLGTVWSSSHVDGEYARIDSGTANPGYLTMAQSYAVLLNGVLSFYFDSSRAVRSGTKYNLNLRGSSPAWESIGGEVQRVVFDPSFADAWPTATYHWFLGFSNLTEIEGIEYLNTSCVTTMSGMFYGCSALETIDVSNFDTRDKLVAWGKQHLTPQGALMNRNNRAETITFGYYRYVINSGNALWKDDEYQTVVLLKRILAEYIPGGDESEGMSEKAHLFNGKKQTDLSNQCIVFRFGKASQSIKGLATYICFELINSRVRSGAASEYKDKIVVLDEAWKLIQSGMARHYLEALYREGRKQNTGVWLISQSYEDFQGENDIFFKYAETKIIMSIPDEEVTQLIEDIELSGSMAAMINEKEGHTQPGVGVLHIGGGNDKHETVSFYCMMTKMELDIADTTNASKPPLTREYFLEGAPA